MERNTLELLIREFSKHYATHKIENEIYKALDSGCTIEQKELSESERLNYAMEELKIYRPVKDGELVGTIEDHLNKHNIPTKLITIKYNDKIIESYEW
jgi:hypothetical protein